MLHTTTAESAAPRNGAAVVVTVSDYLSLAPVAGVSVEVIHGETCTRHGGCKPLHPHPAHQLRQAAKTDAKGRAVFRVPDLEYRVYIPYESVAGYLPFSSTHDMGKQKCHELSMEKRVADGRVIAFDAYVVPESMLAIRTQDDAIAAAMQNQELVTWLRDHQDATMTARGGGGVWKVGFGYDNRFERVVHVNAFDGTAMMLGKWN